MFLDAGIPPSLRVGDGLECQGRGAGQFRLPPLKETGHPAHAVLPRGMADPGPCLARWALQEVFGQSCLVCDLWNWTFMPRS